MFSIFLISDGFEAFSTFYFTQFLCYCCAVLVISSITTIILVSYCSSYLSTADYPRPYFAPSNTLKFEDGVFCSTNFLTLPNLGALTDNTIAFAPNTAASLSLWAKNIIAFVQNIPDFCYLVYYYQQPIMWSLASCMMPL